jgi:hypothetical protein
MGTDKSNQYVTHSEFYKHNKAIVISLDIEHIPLISNAIHAVEGLLNVSKALPLCLLGRHVLDAS